MNMQDGMRQLIADVEKEIAQYEETGSSWLGATISNKDKSIRVSVPYVIRVHPEDPDFPVYIRLMDWQDLLHTGWYTIEKFKRFVHANKLSREEE